MGGADKIWPDFQFHQQADRWPDVAEGTAHDRREINGKVKDMMIFTQQTARPGETCVGSSADDDFEVVKLLFKLLDHGLGGIDLAYAHCVEPDALPAGLSAGDFAESLGPAGPVAVMSNGPIYHQGTIRNRS